MAVLQTSIRSRLWQWLGRQYALAVRFRCRRVDPSESGITQARRAFPHVRYEVGSAYDDLGSRYGTFDLVVSLEVLCCCVHPLAAVRTFLSLIKPGGLGLLTTPYHGYLKNLALAVTGQMDQHFHALWEEGQIVKFFSIATLGTLLRDAGAEHVRFIRVGRIPPLAKSMVAIIEGRGEGSGPSRGQFAPIPIPPDRLPIHFLECFADPLQPEL
jgi:SAM-dependent methyltransferase